ncbi:MAG: hypothetical protein M3N41_12770, partial [Acidobacteriota bacterium]|nr:hypothetical protein [Acidobacteriota bacterium]
MNIKKRKPAASATGSFYHSRYFSLTAAKTVAITIPAVILTMGAAALLALVKAPRRAWIEAPR